MSFDTFPQSETPRPVVTGNQVEIVAQRTSQDAPPAIVNLLTTKLGWLHAGSHPDTFEPLYTKEDKGMLNGSEQNLTDGLYYRWYEAIAYEYAKFIYIGLDDQ